MTGAGAGECREAAEGDAREPPATGSPAPIDASADDWLPPDYLTVQDEEVRRRPPYSHVESQSRLARIGGDPTAQGPSGSVSSKLPPVSSRRATLKTPIAQEDLDTLLEAQRAAHEKLEAILRAAEAVRNVVIDAVGATGMGALDGDSDLAKAQQELDSVRQAEGWLRVELEAARRAAEINLGEQRRLRDELEARRKELQASLAERAHLQEMLEEEREAVAAERTELASEGDELRSEHDQLIAERDELRAEYQRLVLQQDALSAERDQLAASLAAEHRALETAVIDRELMDAERAEWRMKAENEAARRLQMEHRHDAAMETERKLARELDQLRSLQDAALGSDPASANVPRGLVLPNDEATRDELVERLLQAKLQIDALLQERAQSRLKLRLLEARLQKE